MANYPVYPILATTPIKETIFTISYSETIDTEILKIFSQKPEISERYDTVIDGFSTQFVAAEGQKPLADINKDGYIIKCTKEDTIIQARKGSFSFHKVNTYEKFDVLLSELFYLWDKLITCYGQNLSVNNISLRYINFVDYMDEKITDLIQIAPANPFTNELNQSFVHLNFRDKKYENVDINVFTSYPLIKNDTKFIVLDTLLNQKQHYRI
jgi:uncharacterized protein (TIGR04255 family)